ncbi:MAG TPA: hypothetical protein VFG49_08190 [Dyella sp.]|uniref:hypothetical protein n=1 Tax=Dyella sp. TaxID=1869338 RepID=UPI002D794EB4|nr:hypothetical protein [Dyella sp.]HET6553501.1 hypothetical protein [Dyella sp.]
MCKEPTNGIAQALGVARAFRELAVDAVESGRLPREMAISMARTAAEGAAIVQGVLDDFASRLTPQVLANATHSVSELETLTGLADLAASHELEGRQALSLARAMRHTADHAVTTLDRTEMALRAMGG